MAIGCEMSGCELRCETKGAPVTSCIVMLVLGKLRHQLRCATNSVFLKVQAGIGNGRF